MLATVADPRVPTWVSDHTTEEWLWIAHTLLERPPERRPLTLHGAGEPCPVMGLLLSRFDHDEAMYLLWERTCFPMSDWDALPQAIKLVEDA